MRPLQNYLRNLLFAGLILLIGVLAPFLSPAFAAERTVLRVGYVEEPSYAFKNSQGEYDGYTVELLYNIASHGNFTLQFVEFPGYDQEDQALKDGKIDLEGTVPYSMEREKQFLLSEAATLNIPLTLLVRDNDDRFTFGDNQAVNKMRVGVIKNDATAEAFSEWCQRNNLHPQLVYYDDYKQEMTALQDGSVDGITNGDELVTGGQRLLYYAHVSCYAIFNKQRYDLKQLFDTAFRLAMSESPLLEEQLHNEYLVNESINLDLITKSEKAFLAAQHNIVVALQAPNPPYTFTGEGGKLTGILPNYYALLSKATGLQFTFKTYPTEGAALAAVRTGQAQVLGLFSGTQAGAYKNDLRLINMSGNRNLVRIDKLGHAGKKAAVTTRNLPYLEQRLAGQDYDFLAFQDNEACYRALKEGQVDSILCTDIAASWIFNNHRTEGYSMVPLTHTKKLYIAIPASADNALYTILSRGTRKVAPQYNGLVIANVSPKVSLSSFLARLPYWGLAIFAGIMAIMVILLVGLIFLLVRRYHEKSALDARKAENDKEKFRLEALEKNAEEKNQFFANISHDLRTPLNAILGFSHLARQTDNTAEQKTYLEKINSAGKLMLDLVNDTLTMSKLKSGKLELHLEPLPPADILFVPVLDVVREATTAKNISLQVNASQALNRPTLGDKLNLQKILLNLLTNAIKYTPAGGHIKVTIWNETAADGGIDSLFSVQDDGIGVAPEFQERIFEPFTQEKRPGYENFGTGLGLAIVKQLVKLMGGTITLDSVPNQGSTFTVRLRFALVPEADRAAVQTGAAATTAEKAARLQKLRGRKILMCEDNLMNREITVALLKSQGMQVVTANNGRQGVDAFKASAPGALAAILMDLRMPELDGYAATAEIRALSRADAKTVPIIALTAETFTEDIQKCLDCGMNDHVAKPLVPDVLFATLAKYIE
jgi:signal transduction histidine kinase/ABC-type amino acid transport substrate-binding protein/ActR/RegA family two-component response regulator